MISRYFRRAEMICVLLPPTAAASRVQQVRKFRFLQRSSDEQPDQSRHPARPPTPLSLNHLALRDTSSLTPFGSLGHTVCAIYVRMNGGWECVSVSTYVRTLTTAQSFFLLKKKQAEKELTRGLMELCKYVRNWQFHSIPI